MNDTDSFLERELREILDRERERRDSPVVGWSYPTPRTPVQGKPVSGPEVTLQTKGGTEKHLKASHPLAGKESGVYLGTLRAAIARRGRRAGARQAEPGAGLFGAMAAVIPAKHRAAWLEERRQILSELDGLRPRVRFLLSELRGLPVNAVVLRSARRRESV